MLIYLFLFIFFIYNLYLSNYTNLFVNVSIYYYNIFNYYFSYDYEEMLLLTEELDTLA